MKKIFAFLIVILVLGASVLAQADDKLTKIKLAQFGKEKFLLYLPLYVADEEGYFAKNGLKPEYIFAGNDDQIFATVISGEADFGMGDPIFTALAAEKGLGAKTVALMVTNLGLAGYTNKPNVPEIKEAKDLAGLRISSFPAPSTTYTLLAELKTKHPELKDMKIVEGRFGAQLAMLKADKVDIAVDLEPAVSIAEDNGYRVVFPMTPFIEQQAVTGLMVTQQTIDKRPEIIQAAVSSIQQAVNAIYKDRNVAYRTAKKLFPQLSDKVIHAAVNRMIENAMYPTSVVVPDNYWQRTLKTRLDSGELKKLQATSVAVDNRFAEKAQAK